MRNVPVGDSVTAPTLGLLYRFMHTIGASSLNSDEGNAAVASFNKYARLARERARWPHTVKTDQFIPDVRVRSVSVGAGGTGYTSAPTVTIAAPASGGTQATGVATINANGEVNGVSITNEGSGYAEVPTVTFSGGGGSGASATATIVAYIEHGSDDSDSPSGVFTSTIAEMLRVTETDPYTQDAAPIEVPFRVLYEASDYGQSLLINRSSTSPVWCTYRFPQNDYAVGETDFPYVWAEYVLQGALADWYRANGQSDKGGMADRQAEQILLLELDKLERQQGQDIYTHFSTHHTVHAFNQR